MVCLLVIQISDDALCGLADHAKNLKELHVSSVYGVTDFGVSQLAFKCPLLQNLDISYCYVVSNTGLQAFLNKEGKLALTELRIKNCYKVTEMLRQPQPYSPRHLY